MSGQEPMQADQLPAMTRAEGASDVSENASPSTSLESRGDASDVIELSLMVKWQADLCVSVLGMLLHWTFRSPPFCLLAWEISRRKAQLLVVGAAAAQAR
jgi:hypothetical protein